MKEWVESSSLSSPNPVLRIPPEAHFVVEMEVATARKQGSCVPEGMCVCGREKPLFSLPLFSCYRPKHGPSCTIVLAQAVNYERKPNFLDRGLGKDVPGSQKVGEIQRKRSERQRHS